MLGSRLFFAALKTALFVFAVSWLLLANSMARKTAADFFFSFWATSLAVDASCAFFKAGSPESAASLIEATFLLFVAFFTAAFVPAPVSRAFSAVLRVASLPMTLLEGVFVHRISIFVQQKVEEEEEAPPLLRAAAVVTFLACAVFVVRTYKNASITVTSASLLSSSLTLFLVAFAAMCHSNDSYLYPSAILFAYICLNVHVSSLSWERRAISLPRFFVSPPTLIGAASRVAILYLYTQITGSDEYTGVRPVDALLGKKGRAVIRGRSMFVLMLASAWPFARSGLLECWRWANVYASVLMGVDYWLKTEMGYS